MLICRVQFSWNAAGRELCKAVRDLQLYGSMGSKNLRRIGGCFALGQGAVVF